jgi:intracellular septation protein A
MIMFAIPNFGPIAIFYGANHLWGLRVAIVTTVTWSVFEIIFYKLRKKPISMFFLFSSGITVTFGLMDIYLQQSLFFKYEAAMSSLLVGAYFASSLLGKKTLIQEFAEAQGRVQDELTPDREFYFRFLTSIWVGYFLLKAFLYAWIAAHYSLEYALVWRGVFGNASFYGMLFLSIGCSKFIKSILTNFKLFPSQHASDTEAV